MPTTFNAQIWIWKHSKKILPQQISYVILGLNKTSSEKLRATSHSRLRAHDHCTSTTLIGGRSPSRSKFATSHYAWGTNGVCECEMDCNVYMDSYMALNGSCFMVTWTVVKNHLLEVGLIQNWWEAMALWTLTTVDLLCFYCGWGPAWIEIHCNSIWLRARWHMTSCYTWGSVTTLHDLEVCWDGLWTLSFGLSQFHGHGSWLMCEVALSDVMWPCEDGNNDVYVTRGICGWQMSVSRSWAIKVGGYLVNGWPPNSQATYHSGHYEPCTVR